MPSKKKPAAKPAKKAPAKPAKKAVKKVAAKKGLLSRIFGK